MGATAPLCDGARPPPTGASGAQSRASHRGGASRLAAFVALWLGAAEGAGGVVAAGCRAGDQVPPAVDGSADASADVSPGMRACAAGATACVGAEVHACVGGKVSATVVETCAETCTFGRCTTSACATVERKEGLRGCLFYGVQGDNIDADDGRSLMLTLSNGELATAQVTVEARAVAGARGWVSIASAGVPAQGSARLQLSRPVTEPGVTVGGAFRVVSDRPLLAMQLVSDDSDRLAHSSAGTVLRPIQALGTDHLALTHPAAATAEVVRSAGSRGGGGAIAVVATADGTHVSLRLAGPATVGAAGGLVLDPPPPSYDVVLDDGDVLQLFAAGAGADLSGTVVTSDARVAMFSGNVFTTYGTEVTGFAGGDLAQEQLPPTSTWGTRYIGVWLSPPAECQPLFAQPRAGLWQVVAAEEDTLITLAPAPGVVVDLPAQTLRLSRGQSQAFLVYGQPTVAGGQPPTADFVATATQRFLMAQWLDCEAGLALAVDSRLGDTSLRLAFPPGFDHELLLVRAIGTPVKLDDRLIDRARFAAVGAGYEVARLSGADLGRCTDLRDACLHTVTGTGYGLTWRGMDAVCSYATTLPLAGPCVPAGCAE